MVAYRDKKGRGPETLCEFPGCAPFGGLPPDQPAAGLTRRQAITSPGQPAAGLTRRQAITSPGQPAAGLTHRQAITSPGQPAVGPTRRRSNPPPGHHTASPSRRLLSPSYRASRQAFHSRIACSAAPAIFFIAVPGSIASDRVVTVRRMGKKASMPF